jgi:hypothetical protein
VCLEALDTRIMREPGFGNGILLDGTGCHLCQSLEPVGEDTIEVYYNALIETAHRGCQGCWVLSEAVTKCCPTFVDLALFNVLIKVQRPMLRNFIEIIVQHPENDLSLTLDLFSEPGRPSLRRSTPCRQPNNPIRLLMCLAERSCRKVSLWKCDVTGDLRKCNILDQ